MSFRNQISSTMQLMNNELFKLAKLRPLLTEKVAILIYKQTILPIHDYSSFLVDDGYLASDRQKIQRLQNHGLRICTLTPPGPTDIDLLHIRCTVDYLENRRTRHLKRLMFKYVQENKLQISHNLHTRRSSGRPIKPRTPKLKFYKRSRLYRGNMLWNNMPPHQQTPNTLASPFQSCYSLTTLPE